ncbi:MAG: extracellular solute-binding protein [Lachnospiraceae bacterium]|nr:extracellular solute-binding protein [Lachnospiraceae bacterium]
MSKHKSEPVTYTMFFNDNDAYPIKDSWYGEGGIFNEITKETNVSLDITIVNNASYSDKVTLAISGGTAPYIIPKMYSETAYVTGGGIVPVSEYIQYMSNYTGMIEEYDLQSEVDSLLQEDGKYYRLPGLKEAALQNYSILIRSDLFEAAGYDVTALEENWTWDEFTDILVDVKAYMVEQGIVGESDYIWSDRWCGATSGYGQGGCLLNLMAATFGIYSGWGITSNSAGLYFDWDNDEFVLSATSDKYKEYMKAVQRLVSEGILDPETWSQEDDTADGKFYRGETALITTNGTTYTTQIDGLESQLGEGNFSVYEIVIPKGNCNYQTEKSRLECGVCISSTALDELGEDEFIKMMRFVDWLWYSESALTMTKWGVEGEHYTVDEDGNYLLMDEYYCGGLSISQTSDDQVDLRLEYGYGCGNFMYSGSLALLISNFSDELQDYYNRMDEYRDLCEVDPAIAMSEDDSEMANLWATPLQDTINTWTLKFAMGQADIEADWDTYVAEVEAQNAANLVNLYNEYYSASK